MFFVLFCSVDTMSSAKVHFVRILLCRSAGPNLWTELKDMQRGQKWREKRRRETEKKREERRDGRRREGREGERPRV